MKATPGIVCLQGGNELTPECRPMDERLLSLAPRGPVVVLPLASEAGRDYTTTAGNASAYFTALGADVVAPEDPRRGSDSAADAVESAGLVVLTGGSPRRLRDALVATRLDEKIRARWHSGALVMGSSAGAMVACSTTLLPQWRGDPQTGPGLGLVRGHVVVPHYDGKRGAWVRVALSAEPAVLGIPECSGVLVRDGQLTALGVAPSVVITDGGSVQLSLS
jgi:cyanophycinase-like exopeptidase